MTDKPLSAEEESALRKLCESVRCGWCEQRHEMNRLFTTLDASRAETAALKERQREAVSEIVSSYEAHGDTGLRLEAVEALAADLVEGLAGLVARYGDFAPGKPFIFPPNHHIDLARALLTRAAALGVGKQDGGLAIFDEASDVPARVDRPAAATAAAEGRREGEGVMEDCWYPVVSALGSTGETDPYTLGKAAVDAVHPAIFAAGERAGLEKAAAKMKHLHGGGEADNPHDAGWQAACVAGERAILSLKGGAP